MSFVSLPLELQQQIVMSVSQPSSLLRTSKQYSILLQDPYLRKRWELQHPKIGDLQTELIRLKLPEDEARIVEILNYKVPINKINLNVLRRSSINFDFFECLSELGTERLYNTE